MYEGRVFFRRSLVSDFTLSRRKFLVLGASTLAVASTPFLRSSVLAAPRFSSRNLSLYNLHTKETFEGIYWREGEYNEKALKRLTYVLRDWRNQKEHPIDPKLFDVLYRLNEKLGTKEEYQIICGYRSKETNEMLRAKSSGVAKNSLHCCGKAIDLRLHKTSLKDLRDTARALKAGGVGYYPKSNFVHLDVRGKPAAWG